MEKTAAEIIERLGGTTKTAELCKVTPGAVSQWLHSGIPEPRLMYLKLARPDVFEDGDSGQRKGRSRRSTDPH